jgi:hypothetical protein
VKKTLCSLCNCLITNNNIKKHRNICNKKPSWFVRKNNNLPIKSCNRVDQFNWNEIQNFYNQNNTYADICNKWNINTTLVANAIKKGLLKTRLRSETARIRGKYINRKLSETTKQKLSQSMRKAVLEGRQKTPRPYGKNCTLYKAANWKGEIETLQGSWERDVANFLNLENIKWERPKNSFTYIFENKQREYFPDFFLPDYNVYIEVKGWKQKKDFKKWKYFPEKLLVIDKGSIYNLKSFFDKNLMGC